jgi:hypothetical protein
VWRTASSQSPHVAGSSFATAVVHGQLHVVASGADGKGASHLRLDEASLSDIGEVPLRSVTGAIDAEGGLLACGARVGDDAPVVCRLDRSGQSVEVMPLASVGAVAAWPRLVGTPRGRYVVWATGELLDATVWLSEVKADRLAEPVKVLEGVGTFAFHAAGSANGVDVLCYGETLDFARWQTDAALKRRLQTTNDSAATLLDGAVLWPTARHTFDVWLVEPDEHRVLELPEPPERASAQARHLRLAAEPHEDAVLYWETHLPDDFRMRMDDDSSRMVHGFSVRAWLGHFDRQTWRVTDAIEVRASSAQPSVAWVGGTLALVDSDAGVLEVRLAERV